MAKNKRKKSLVRKELSYNVFGKRFCDLTEEEHREYNRLMKAKSRKRRRGGEVGKN